MQSSMTGAKKALTFVTSIALALGGAVGFSTAAQAADAGKVFVSFEDGDTIGAAAAAFEGGASTAAATTHLTGKSLQFTKSGQAWSGLNLLGSASTAYHYADAASHTITLDYWSNDTVASPVMLKLETSVPSWQGGPSTAKALEAQPGLNHLSFDMSTATGWDASKEWVVAAIFPDFGTDDAGYKGAGAVAVSGQVYEIDNVSLNGGTVDNVNGAGNAPAPAIAATSTLLTFEAADSLGATATAGGFEGATASIVDAPANGNGGKALQITKAGQPWAGVNLVAAPTGVKFLDATHTSVTLNFFSPDSVKTPAQFQFVATDGSKINQAVETSPGWQTLTFDFSASYNDAKTYTAAVFFPDFVNSGDVPGYTGAAAIAGAGQNYAIDNVGFNGAVTPAIAVPKIAPSLVLSFETGDANGAKVLNSCGGATWECAFEGAVVAIADAPAGGNGGKALKVTKSGQPWAGLNLLQAPADTKLADATHSHVTFNYFSPDAAKSPVQIQLISDSNSTISMAVEASPGWQVLDIDMSTAVGYSASASYVKMVLFPDFVNKGDVPSYKGANAVAVANQIYYVDNVAFNGGVTPAIPVAPANVAPAMTAGATVSGTAKVGKSLTAAKGTWTGTPAPTFTYSWYRCTVTGKAATAAPAAATKCVAIAKATAATYKLVAADKGKYVRVLVKATNSVGSKFSLSAATAKIG